jgi:2-keto-4-pentenoate hydratase/2-oxohepta-3-ene-1,7-dioic acid hydratase in catechol pathway
VIRLKIARILVDNKESYGFIKGYKLFAKDDVEKDLGIKLPQTIEEFLLSPINLEFNNIEPLEHYRLLPPITKPSKIICLGFNYLDHAKEQNKTPPEEPVIFFKPRTTLIGAFDDIIAPNFIKKLDYEAELAVIINKECKNVSIEEAMDYVLGYMVFNDISARDIQFKDVQWSRGKSFDTFAPCNYITTKDEINDIYNLKIVTKVNNEIRQYSNTSNMYLKIDKIISSLSEVMRLEPLDIIATGTPAGVAYFTDKRFLKNNDLVEVEIEGLGKLSNKVRFA